MKLDVMQPAIKEAVEEFRTYENDDAVSPHENGRQLAARVEAALHGSDWRYVKNQPWGGGREREL